jgi:hypothetical protein
MSNTRERLDAVVDRLRAAVDELDDIAFDVLRDASARGVDRPNVDKEIVRARRSIEKAVLLLSGE